MDDSRVAPIFVMKNIKNELLACCELKRQEWRFPDILLETSETYTGVLLARRSDDIATN